MKKKINALLRNKAVVGIACIVLAVLIGFVASPLLVSAMAKQPKKTTESTTSDIYSLQPGQQLASVEIKNFADGLSGKLQSGDIVSIYCPQDATLTGSDQTQVLPALNPPELQYVKVAAVTASTGKDTDAKKISSDSGAANSLPATVTLIVNTQQMQILTGLENRNIHFALVCRSNAKYAKQLLAGQAALFSASSSSAGSSGSSSAAGTGSSSSATSTEVQ